MEELCQWRQYQRKGHVMEADSEVPGDIHAFYGHPLNAASDVINGDGLALLHEYRSLPAISTLESMDNQHVDAMGILRSVKDRPVQDICMLI